jgi:tripartite-type tricarboxylate transporter receptor subunit TctC
MQMKRVVPFDRDNHYLVAPYFVWYDVVRAHKTHKLSAVMAVVVLLTSALSLSSPRAADWPTKSVRIIVPYAAGGAGDRVGRVFAEQLSATLGQQFIVENRTGGAGLIGSDIVARSAADGYTLMIAGMASHVLGPAMNSKNVNFDPLSDFTHIAYLGGPPNLFVVHSSRGIKSFDEFMTLLRNKKDGVEYVSPSVGSVGNVVAQLFAAKAKVNLVHVGYRGGGAAILDLVAGHIPVGSLTMSTTIEHIKAGTLIPICISSAERVSELPDVPTLKELGFPELVTTTWFELAGPAGLPVDVVARLNNAVNESMKRPQVIRYFHQDGIQTKSMTPLEVQEYVRTEIAKWTPAVKSTILDRVQ